MAQWLYMSNKIDIKKIKKIGKPIQPPISMSRLSEKIQIYKSLALIEALLSAPLYCLVCAHLYFENCHHNEPLFSFRLSIMSHPHRNTCDDMIWLPLLLIASIAFFIVNLVCINCININDGKRIIIRRSCVSLLTGVLSIKIVICVIVSVISFASYVVPFAALLAIMDGFLIIKMYSVLHYSRIANHNRWKPVEAYV